MTYFQCSCKGLQFDKVLLRGSLNIFFDFTRNSIFFACYYLCDDRGSKIGHSIFHASLKKKFALYLRFSFLVLQETFF